MANSISRRDALRRLAGASALMTAASVFPQTTAEAASPSAPTAFKGRVRHSVCKWCYPDVSLESLCQQAEAIGLQAIDLLEVSDFPLLKQYGVSCAMVTGVPGGIPNGYNRVSNHAALNGFMRHVIPLTAEAGFPNVICFSGNRGGMSDDEGLEHCTTGLKQIIPLAEKQGVTICMELLNSRVDHHDYMADHTAWGVELCKRVGSERFKLLYDIYHMQIMEGDVIATIRANQAYIAHYHTGGVPGRHEIDSSQELNYAAIMRAIVDTGFKGFVAQEFIPVKADKLASLREAVRLCDV